MIPKLNEQRKPHTLEIIEEINKVLGENKDKLKKKQVYELLIRKGVLEIDTYKAFSRYFDAGVKDGLIDLSRIDNTKKRTARPIHKRAINEVF